MTKRALNEKVNITGWTFRNSGNLSTFPRRMEYQGATYTFMDGLQFLVKRGESVKRIFDMTDGTTGYRLTTDEHQNEWRLVAITSYA